MEKKSYFKSKEDAELFLDWCGLLQADPGKETEVLEGQQGCCCLGWGCYVTIPSDKLLSWDDSRLRGSNPRDQKAAPSWLKEIDFEMRKRTGKGVILMNDGGGEGEGDVYALNHPEIGAELLRVFHDDVEYWFTNK